MTGRETVDWRCSCGAMTARLEAGDGMRLTCYCRHCRAFLRHLGREEMLDAAGGSDLYQTVPERFRILTGADRLACLRMTPKGPLRWYASCCGTPVANTLAGPGIAFASVALGPVAAHARPGEPGLRVFAESATGDAPGRNANALSVVLPVVSRALRARLTGGWRRTPFFTRDGRPLAAPHLIGTDERARAYDETGGGGGRAPGA